MEKGNHYVYEIVNKINDKRYIGKRSCNCKIETDNYMGSGKILKYAQKKYGIENFEKKILEICFNCGEALRIERQYINYYNALKSNGYYNLTAGGQGSLGYKPTQETLIKLSESHKNPSEEIREKYRNAKLGKKASAETKVKMKENSKHYWEGKTFTDEHKIKLSEGLKGKNIGELNHFYGKHHTEETKLLNSLAHKGEKHVNWGQHLSEQTKEKISRGNKGKILTDEHKKKISEANKGKPSHMLGKYGELNHRSKQVMCITTSMVYGSAREAGRKTSIDYSSIIRCCNGQLKHAGKLEWVYQEQIMLAM